MCEIKYIGPDSETICPECMEKTSMEELDRFNGLCETCREEYPEEPSAYKQEGEGGVRE